MTYLFVIKLHTIYFTPRVYPILNFFIALTLYTPCILRTLAKADQPQSCISHFICYEGFSDTWVAVSHHSTTTNPMHLKHVALAKNSLRIRRQLIASYAGARKIC